MEIALYCDLRIASDDVVFGLPEVGLGILPAAGGTQTLPRLLGLAASLDMLLTGRRLMGKEAFDSDMVHQLVPKDRLLQLVEEVALKIASFNPVAVRSAKQAVKKGMDMTLDQGLDLEQRLALKCRK